MYEYINVLIILISYFMQKEKKKQAYCIRAEELSV